MIIVSTVCSQSVRLEMRFKVERQGRSDEVLTAVKMSTVVFCVGTPYSLVGEDAANTFLRTGGNPLQAFTVSQPRRLQSTRSIKWCLHNLSID
jgi:hypothetical protein